MTSALINAIDQRGFVEFSKKGPNGACSTQQYATSWPTIRTCHTSACSSNTCLLLPKNMPTLTT